MRSHAARQGLGAGCALRSPGQFRGHRVTGLPLEQGLGWGQDEGLCLGFPKFPTQFYMHRSAETRCVSTVVLRLGEVVRTTQRV